ncbi:glycosyl transferase [Dyadobacter sp. CY356]|uniref:glycosyl transferase n=1 Tax=Dyadobacter sp. CY356 TaxID=2906442 RepID=UPI001F212F61|nr:glycosyl transferase [Dyadobacter sp. CY356]MCF0055934.1 glycosyl transferase [Dyadobacter sp. CY356]
MQNFCTLFNSFYLSRGLAMYYSLLKQSSDFHLYIFAFDDDCHATLSKMDLSNATIISLNEFETPELLAIKSSRTPGEYCWTCTASTIWHCIHTFSLDHCTYIDADLLFFSDPKILTDEMGNNAVLITEHRYNPDYDQSELSGIYCVQFITFKNTEQGLKVLDWWRKACITWCYNRFEDGKFGDQKYLDDWTTRFEGVHVMQHTGGGVAPWNCKTYSYERIAGQIMVKSPGSEAVPLVFYHFHDFRYSASESFRLTAEQYLLNSDAIRLIYGAYANALRDAESKILLTDKSAVFHENLLQLTWIKISLSRQIHYLLKGRYKNYSKKHTLQSNLQ